jgi:hypothetical protein
MITANDRRRYFIVSMIPSYQRYLSTSEFLSAGFSYYRINKLVTEGKLIKLNNKTYESTAYNGYISDFVTVSAYAPKVNHYTVESRIRIRRISMDNESQY